MSNYIFSIDKVYVVAGKPVVFIPDEFGESSRFNDGVQLLPALDRTPACFVRDSDIDYARNAGLAMSEAGPDAEASADVEQPGQAEPGNGAPRDAASALEMEPLQTERLPIQAPPLRQRFAQWANLAARASTQASRRLASARMRRATPVSGKPGSRQKRRTSVFGFWNTALHNHAVDLLSPLTVVPTGQFTGLYLRTVNGEVVDTGSYVGGYVPGAETPLESATILTLTPATLRSWKLPSTPALTSIEIVQHRQALRRNRIYKFCATGVAAIVLAIAIYVQYASTATARQTELNMLTAQQNAILTEVTTSKKLKLSPDLYPDVTTVLGLFAAQQLYYGTQGLFVDWQDIAAPTFREFTAVSSDPVNTLTFPHTRRPLADGATFYAWPKAPLGGEQL